MVKRFFFCKDVKKRAIGFDNLEQFIDYCEGNDIVWQLDDIDYDCEKLYATCVEGTNVCFYSDNKDELLDEDAINTLKKVIEHLKSGIEKVSFEEKYGDVQTMTVTTSDEKHITMCLGESKMLDSITNEEYLSKYHAPFSVYILDAYAEKNDKEENKEETEALKAIINKIH